jgi:hypothetical protein
VNESFSTAVFGLVAVVAVTYLGFKVRQDRERLRKIVGIIDREHSFDMAYLCNLADRGLLSSVDPATTPTA